MNHVLTVQIFQTVNKLNKVPERKYLKNFTSMKLLCQKRNRTNIERAQAKREAEN